MRLLLGVCGGIAAYKALETARLAVKQGHAVRVVCTDAATRFVGPASFAGITGAPVLLTEWEPDPLRGVFPGDPLPAHAPLSHLELVHRADVYLVAPASANTLAKLAHGLADNLLTTAFLARTGPVVVAPAMNEAMLHAPATVANLEALRARGVRVLEPGVGALGSIGEWGAGRLPEPAALLAACEAALRVPDLAGRRVLVTAGGTREPIDAVRYIGNRSSGRMGYAVAADAARRGAQVTVVAANVALAQEPGVTYVPVETAEQLRAACAAHFADCDLLVMAAAVADFRPVAPHAGKLKKTAADTPDEVALERTVDVLAELSARRRDDQVLIGFAAEHGDGAVAYGRDKLVRKGLDAVVVNDVSDPGIGFDALENEVVLVTATGERTVPRAAKADVARAILDLALSLRSSPPTRVSRP